MLPTGGTPRTLRARQPGDCLPCLPRLPATSILSLRSLRKASWDNLVCEEDIALARHEVGRQQRLEHCICPLFQHRPLLLLFLHSHPHSHPIPTNISRKWACLKRILKRSRNRNKESVVNHASKLGSRLNSRYNFNSRSRGKYVYMYSFNSLRLCHLGSSC